MARYQAFSDLLSSNKKINVFLRKNSKKIPWTIVGYLRSSFSWNKKSKKEYRHEKNPILKFHQDKYNNWFPFAGLFNNNWNLFYATKGIRCRPLFLLVLRFLQFFTRFFDLFDIYYFFNIFFFLLCFNRSNREICIYIKPMQYLIF